MNRSNFKPALMAVAVISICGGVCASSAEVQAREFKNSVSAGDPGDGLDTSSSVGGCGGTSEYEHGDPTDGNGCEVPVGQNAIKDSQILATGDPGDGEESELTELSPAMAPRSIWVRACWLVADFMFRRR